MPAHAAPARVVARNQRLRMPTVSASPADTPSPRAWAALLEPAADALVLALLLVTASGRLLHANAAGRALLARGTWLHRAADGSLTARPDAAAARALLLACAQAAQGQRQWLRAPEATGSPASATVVRLPGRRQDDPAVLLLTVSDPSATRELSAYAAAHGLTPAETRVLALLCQGLDQAQAAASLGVSLSTLRSHLSALRRKTGHRRLTTLVPAVARLPPLQST